MSLLKKFFFSGLGWLWVTVIVLAIDRFAKIWAINNLAFGEPIRIMPLFNLTLAYNTGAAFSFLHTASGWQQFFLGGLAIVVSTIILIWLSRISAHARWLSISLCLILAGALGNAWDRMLYGYVIDFFSFHIGDWHFAIFNTADSAICIGAAMMLWDWIKNPVRM